MINTNKKKLNKALFDQLHAHREEVEEVVGEALSWERLDEKTTCRIAVRIQKGGWGDEESWDVVIPATVNAMIRLHKALGPLIPTLKRSVD